MERRENWEFGAFKSRQSAHRHSGPAEHQGPSLTWLGILRGGLGPPGYRGDMKGCRDKKKQNTAELSHSSCKCHPVPLPPSHPSIQSTAPQFRASQPINYLTFCLSACKCRLKKKLNALIERNKQWSDICILQWERGKDGSPAIENKSFLGRVQRNSQIPFIHCFIKQ